MNTTTDVLVVGAGIVGLAHAVEALDRGLTVTVVERDSRAVGASIRNFGHACVTGQSGDLAELAHLARERWLDLDGRAGLGARATGGLAVAR
ncbi:FAD-dependent oxidoreductase, partial [Tsukamurella tyrosinosolvens]